MLDATAFGQGFGANGLGNPYGPAAHEYLAAGNSEVRWEVRHGELTKPLHAAGQG